MKDDLISRQAAIDEIDEWIKAFRENGHKESAADACLIQDGIIQLLSAQPRWIPCSERLPEEYGEYICTMENGQVQECGFVPEKQKGLITGWSTCEADGNKLLHNKDVLAWMPLPEPYREGE